MSFKKFDKKLRSSLNLNPSTSHCNDNKNSYLLLISSYLKVSVIMTCLLIYLIIYIRDKMRFTLHTNMAKFVGFNMLDISVFFSQKDDILNKIRIALIHLKKNAQR